MHELPRSYYAVIKEFSVVHLYTKPKYKFYRYEKYRYSKTSGKSNLTYDCIAAAHGSFNRRSQ